MPYSLYPGKAFNQQWDNLKNRLLIYFFMYWAEVAFSTKGQNGVGSYLRGILEWSKCGDDYLSALPTLLWTVGAIAFSHRIINAMFRRFLFRRVPVWEQILQHLLFVWMVLYSLHFWHALVRLLKALVEYYDEDDELLEKDSSGLNFMQQSVIWLCGATPLAIYMYSKQRSSEPPLMIWITTNPWQRREMGPYGYYLNRPFSTMESNNNLSLQERTLMLRRAHSDTKITLKEPPRKRRSSKSV